MWQRHRHDIHENRLQAAGRYSHVCRECWAVLKIAYYHTTRASIKHVYFVRVHFICINRKKKFRLPTTFAKMCNIRTRRHKWQDTKNPPMQCDKWIWNSSCDFALLLDYLNRLMNLDSSLPELNVQFNE